jgi:Ni/Fe-hydrogenase subunit HybB-like protein
MTAYIVGLVAGSIITVFPLIYLMNVDRCVALVLQTQPDFSVSNFSPSFSPALASSVVAVGAVVLLVSITLIAITGLKQLRRKEEAEKNESGAGRIPEDL